MTFLIEASTVALTSPTAFPLPTLTHDAAAMTVGQIAQQRFRDPSGESSTVDLRPTSGGTEVMIMGDGLDIVYSGFGDDWISAAGNAAPDTSDPFGYDTTGTQRLHGGNGNDRLKFVDDGSGGLFGDNGNDILRGGNFGDIIDGGSDDDTLFGMGGDDYMYGGGNGNSRLYGGAGDDTIDTGSPTGSSVVRGGDGDDTINNRGGSDKLFGEAGNDTIDVQGSNRSYALGGDGNDFIDSSAVSTTFTGGDGQDTFKMGTAVTGTVHRIKDFTIADDTLQLVSNAYDAADRSEFIANAIDKGTHVIVYDDTKDNALILEGLVLADLNTMTIDFI